MISPFTFFNLFSSFLGVVLREAENKVSKVISSNWVRDDDIKRLLMTLPNWMNLHSGNVDEVLLALLKYFTLYMQTMVG